MIEAANSADLVHLPDIHAASFDRGWTDGEFDALLAQDIYFCLVARNPGNAEKPPSGFVLVKRVADEAEIISIAVKPSARKKGIARQLMDAAVRQLDSERIKKLFLEVDAENNPAIKLYTKMGFVQIASRDGYYQRNDTAENKRSVALVMQLELG